MKFKIHRGSREIGGTCVEIWTENTRIVIDFGMPLVEKDKSEFDLNKYKDLTIRQLINKSILPNIVGLYLKSTNAVDGVLISHSHIDHYGLISYISNNVKYFLGKATDKIIKLNNLFTNQNVKLENFEYFEKEKAFEIGDFKVTPFWMDHSAFDSYSFLIESHGKSIFYSGDFRGHGRKSKAFDWLLKNVPQKIDYLFLEGTSIGRENEKFKTENDIENQLLEIFKKPGKINLIYTSGQNIDRITSIYKACKKSEKIFVIDIYVAKILQELSKFAKIPYPSKDFENLKVFFPYFTSKKLKNSGYEKILYQFKNLKITKEEINNLSEQVVMLVRPSMKKDLEYIQNINGGNLIYSLWEGYLEKQFVKDFVNYLKERKCGFYSIHTSGHADIYSLKKLVKAISPKFIVPIHTFESERYKDIFDYPVLNIEDCEEIIL